MDFSDTNGFVRFRNLLYHDIANHFNITRENAQRFANAARRVFSGLRCNKVDVVLAHAPVIQVQGYDGEIEYDHCRFCTETHVCRNKVKTNNRKVKVKVNAKVNQVKIRTDMATVTGIGNVTVIKVLPTEHGHHTNPALPADGSAGKTGRNGATLIGRLKRAIGPITLFGKTWGKKPTNSNFLKECLDFDRFWTTTNDANLIMGNRSLIL